MSDHDVIAAELVTPAFRADLSTWRITVSRDGRLRQEIRLSNDENSYRGELREEVTQLLPADVDEMLALAEQIGFRGFRDNYTHELSVVTGLATWSISVRFGNTIKTVEAYGPDDIARTENNPDMAGFVELLNRIHRDAPYPHANRSGAAE